MNHYLISKTSNEEKKNMRGFQIVSKYQDQVLILPERSTTNAAGYDFRAAEDIVIPAKKNGDQQLPKPTLVPTGIKAYMQPNEVLLLINRSSGPIKRSLVQPNGVGVIDADYYNNEANEGEIYGQLINLGSQDYLIHKGDRIFQGIFVPFLTVDGDNGGKNKRQGGFGSTDQTDKQKTHTSQSALKEETKQTESEDKQLLIMLVLLVILIVLLVLITKILSAYPID